MLAGRYLTLLPMLALAGSLAAKPPVPAGPGTFPTATPLFMGLLVFVVRSEEHTSELQSHSDLVCRLLLEKKKKKIAAHVIYITYIPRNPFTNYSPETHVITDIRI